MLKMMPLAAVVIALAVLLSYPGAYSAQDVTAPHVISTSPENGARDVDPKLTHISVTFSEPMMDKGWSWCYADKSKFPQVIGKPQYKDNFTTNEITVKLEPDKEYEIWINTSKKKNFKDRAGNPATPYRLTFKTGK